MLDPKPIAQDLQLLGSQRKLPLFVISVCLVQAWIVWRMT